MSTRPRPVEEDGGLGDVVVPRAAGRRRVIYAGGLVAVLIAGAIAFAVYGPGRRAAPARYVTALVDRGPIAQVVTATGTLNPVTTVQVGTYVSGPIQALDVDFNSPVRKGQRVAKIDPAPFAVKVREAEANVANAQAKLQKDRADLKLKKLVLERNRVLRRQGLIAQNDLDTVESDAAQAGAQLALDDAAVAQAQASLDEARVNLGYTDILSPVDGVVVARNVDVGQTVAASFQTPTLFLIAEDLTKMQVDTNVSESDVGRVREGQATTFTVDAYPGQAFHGTVAQVRNAPITVQNVVTYDVVIAVDNSGLELKPGMTANVSVSTARRDQALRLPLRALSFRPEPAASASRAPSEATVVYVVGANDGLRRVEVRTGVRDNQHVELLEGALHEGDRVAVGIRHDTDGAGPARPPGFAAPRRF